MFQRAILPLLLLAIPAYADWSGFPLTASTNHFAWYTVNDAHEPMRQIVEAYRERMTATGNMTTNWTYVETYAVDAGVLVTNELMGGEWYWNQGWGFGYEEPNTNGEYLIYYNDEYVWVIPQDLIDYGGGFYDIFYGATVYTNTYYLSTNIVITNTPSDFKFGQFTVHLGGHSYTGHAFVTKGLLDMLWGGLDDVLGVGGDWIIPDLATNTAYYSDTNLIGFTQSSDGGVDEWTVDPPDPPMLSFAYVWDKFGLGSIESLTTNALGLVTGGLVEYYDTPTNLAFDVLLAEVDHAITNRTDISTNDVPEYIDQYGWQTRLFSAEPGIDYPSYAADSAWTNGPAWITASTNASALEITAQGFAYSNAISSVATNPASTNLVWNKDYTNSPAFSSVVTPASVATNYAVTASNQVEETLSISNASAVVWNTITNITVTGIFPSNEISSFSLVWPTVDRWQTAPYRLYALDLDRLYYTLSEMRFSLHSAYAISNNVGFSGFGRVGWSTNYNDGFTEHGCEYDGGQVGDDIPYWWPDSPLERAPLFADAVSAVQSARQGDWVAYPGMAGSLPFSKYTRVATYDDDYRDDIWWNYNERLESADSEIHISTPLGSATNRAVVMMGDYSGSYRTRDGAVLAAMPGYRRGPSSQVVSGPTTNAISLAYPGYRLRADYPFVNALVLAPMQMDIVGISDWSSTTNYAVGPFGSTDIPAYPSEPASSWTYSKARDFEEISGYEITDLRIVLEWQFQYKSAE